MPFISPFPNFVLVCPSNWGSATFTLSMAVNPSLKSSPVKEIFSFFFAFIRLFFDAWLFSARVRADLKPERCVPPSIVFILLTKVRMLSLYEWLYLNATSTGTSPVSFLTVTTLLWRGLLFSSRYFTKSLRPPLNLKESVSPSSVRASCKTISSPLLR